MNYFSLLKWTSFVFLLLGVLKMSSAQSNDVELKRALKAGAFLVDVRTPQEFASGSVKGAVNIPLDEIQQKLSIFKGKKSIVVFCRSGNRSHQAKMILERNHIQQIFDGGPWTNVNRVMRN